MNTITIDSDSVKYSGTSATYNGTAQDLGIDVNNWPWTVNVETVRPQYRAIATYARESNQGGMTGVYRSIIEPRQDVLTIRSA